MKIDISKDTRIFRRAWEGQVIPKYTLAVTETWDFAMSQGIWWQEFGCRMVKSELGKWTEAEWDDESLYTAFLLRWS